MIMSSAELHLPAAQPVIIATHERSGTHLTIDFIRRNFPATRISKRPLESLNCLYLNLDRLNVDHENKLDLVQALSILQKAKRPLVKTHSLPDFPNIKIEARELQEWIVSKGDVIYVHRDVREVMASLYEYRSNLLSERGILPGQFIRQAIGGSNPVQDWVNHVTSWLEYSPQLVLSYHQILANPFSVVDELEKKLSLTADCRQPLLPQQIRNKWEGRLLRLLPGSPKATTIFGPGSTSNSTLPWTRLFDQDDQMHILRIAGGLMRVLGYIS